MKLLISILTIFLFIACNGKPPADNAKAANIKARNEELALTNEVSAITRTAQKLEKQGRGLENYRNSRKVEALRECDIIAEAVEKRSPIWRIEFKNFQIIIKLHSPPSFLI